MTGQAHQDAAMDMAVNKKKGNLPRLESELVWLGRDGRVRCLPINMLS
jgi:hypothetical protein